MIYFRSEEGIAPSYQGISSNMGAILRGVECTKKPAVDKTLAGWSLSGRRALEGEAPPPHFVEGDS